MTDVVSPTVMITLNSTSAFENEDLLQLDETVSTNIPLNTSTKAIETVYHNDKGYYIDDVDDGKCRINICKEVSTFIFLILYSVSLHELTRSIVGKVYLGKILNFYCSLNRFQLFQIKWHFWIQLKIKERLCS